ncbi:hypothetical protein J4466_05785 [Candidatus Pacearchaeota archaeon]|nr:hypothetical protein [Candidatus Pacearchaeota archaeon]
MKRYYQKIHEHLEAMREVAGEYVPKERTLVDTNDDSLHNPLLGELHYRHRTQQKYVPIKSE